MLAVGLVLPVLRATEFFVLEQLHSPSPTASRLRLITKRTLIPRWGTPDVQPSATRGTAIPGAVPERGEPSTCWDDVVRLPPNGPTRRSIRGANPPSGIGIFPPMSLPSSRKEQALR